MKKQLAAVLLALTLAGCTSAQRTNQVRLFSGQTDPPAESSLQMISGPQQETDGAYMLQGGRADNSCNILYVDYAGRTAVPLCSQAGCTHTDKTCPSWLPGPPDWYRVIPLGEELYLWDLWRDTGIWEIDRTSGGRHLLTEPEASQKLLNGDMAASDEYLFYPVIEFNEAADSQRIFLYRYDRKTGEAKRLHAMEEGETLVGAFGNQLYVTIPGPPSSGQADDWEEWNARTRGLYTVSLEGDRSPEPLCTWVQGEQAVGMFGSLLYQLNAAQGVLTVTDLAGGTQQTMQDDRLRSDEMPQVIAPAAEGATLCLTGQTGENRWYLYHDGQLTESPYDCMGADAYGPRNRIMADGDGYYLVQRGGDSADCVLVTKEDFWAGAGAEQDIPLAIQPS